MTGITPFIGTQWMIVSRQFCDFVCNTKISERYKHFYKNTFIPDEGFFQTVMMNNDCHGEIIQDDLRLIDWVPDGDIKLRPRTFTILDAAELMTSDHLFARKFDIFQDAEVIDQMELHLSAANQIANHTSKALTDIHRL